MTRASTPGSLSTRTERVWRSVAGFFISMASHHHLAFLGGSVLEALRGVAEQHLVMRAAGRDHRKAIFGRIDHAVEDHRAIDREHFSDPGIELVRFCAADADAMIRLGELDKIRQRLGVALRVAPAVQQLLPLPYHAHVLVVAE